MAAMPHLSNRRLVCLAIWGHHTHYDMLQRYEGFAVRFGFGLRPGLRGASARLSNFSNRATNSNEPNGRPVRS